MSADEIISMFRKTPCASCNEAVLVGGTLLLLLILIAEFFDWTVLMARHDPCPKVCPKILPPTDMDYGYEDYNGPSVWKLKFSRALGSRQSPINIISRNALVCPSTPLCWSNEYTRVPNSIRICNDGHCVILQIRYTGFKPTISGGPLQSSYELHSIKFRWGSTDDEGSEHTIDFKRFSMELQAVHLKCGCNKYDMSNNICDNDNVLIVSYILQTTNVDNPYLEPIIHKLEDIRCPGYCAMVPQFPACWLLPAFASDYFMYQGSLTYPPCSEGVHWIVQPETIAVSPRQIRKFRKLITNTDTKMLSNARPIQCLNSRDIFYYTTDGSIPCNVCSPSSPCTTNSSYSSRS